MAHKLSRSTPASGTKQSFTLIPRGQAPSRGSPRARFHKPPSLSGDLQGQPLSPLARSPTTSCCQTKTNTLRSAVGAGKWENPSLLRTAPRTARDSTWKLARKLRHRATSTIPGVNRRRHNVRQTLRTRKSLRRREFPRRRWIPPVPRPLHSDAHQAASVQSNCQFVHFDKGRREFSQALPRKRKFDTHGHHAVPWVTARRLIDALFWLPTRERHMCMHFPRFGRIGESERSIVARGDSDNASWENLRVQWVHPAIGPFLAHGVYLGAMGSRICLSRRVKRR